MAKSKNVNLAKLFGVVTQQLAANKTELNQADTYNHDHGDHMVEIFEVITQAVKEKKKAEPADQLEYAADLLRQRSSSGSAQIYQQGLLNASREFKGKKVDSSNLMNLVTTLMGAQQPDQPAASGGSADLLGSLLSGMAGKAASSQTAAPQGGSADLLGSLLSGMTGGGSTQKAEGGLDASDLLSAGMAFMQSKQRGQSNVEALVNAVVGNTAMGQSSHRAQSSNLVINTLLKALTSGK